MAIILPEGKQSFTDDAGNPLAGGKLYTYDAGTTTPRLTWSDSAQTAPHTNPIILDARGEATIFWNGAYKVELRTAADVVIWTVDNVTATQINATGAFGLQMLATATAQEARVLLGDVNQTTQNLAALRLVAYAGLPTGTVIYMAGYHTAGDMGSGFFKWDSSSTATDDAGLVVNPTGNAGAGRWLRIVTGAEYNICWFGAKDVAGFDNGPSIRAAINAACAQQWVSAPTNLYDATTLNTVFVPKGLWEVSTVDPAFVAAYPARTPVMLWLYKGVRLIGEGGMASVIQYGYGSIAHVVEASIQPGGFNWNGQVKGLCFYKAAASADCNAVVLYGLGGSVIQGWEVDEIQVRGCNHGVWLTGIVYNCTVTNLQILDVNGTGLNEDAGAGYNRWDVCQSYPKATTGGLAFDLRGASSSYGLLTCAGPARIFTPTGVFDTVVIEELSRPATGGFNGDAALRIDGIRHIRSIVIIDPVKGANTCTYGVTASTDSAVFEAITFIYTALANRVLFPIVVAGAGNTFTSIEHRVGSTPTAPLTALEAANSPTVLASNTWRYVSQVGTWGVWSQAYTLPVIAAGAKGASVTIAANGISLGANVQINYSLDQQSCTFNAYVSAAGTITFYPVNNGAGATVSTIGTVTARLLQT